MKKSELKKLIKECIKEVWDGIDNLGGAESMGNIHRKNLDKFTKSYVETALATSMDNTTPSGGYPLDKNYGIDDIESNTLEKMIQDCRKFQSEFGELFFNGGWSDEEAGRDFWLNRNGHGTGFWDKTMKYDGKDDDAAKRLADASHRYGEFNLYIADSGPFDGMICGG